MRGSLLGLFALAACADPPRLPDVCVGEAGPSAPVVITNAAGRIDVTAADMLIDVSAPSSESFWLALSSTPTTATLYSLSLTSLDAVKSANDIVANVVQSTQLTFSVRGISASAVPEPTAAVVFGMGLLVAHAGLRRR